MSEMIDILDGENTLIWKDGDLYFIQILSNGITITMDEEAYNKFLQDFKTITTLH